MHTGRTVQVVPIGAASNTKRVAAAVTVWEAGGEQRSRVQRLVNVPHKMQHETQSS